MTGGIEALSEVYAHLLSLANSNEYLVTLHETKEAWELHSLGFLKYDRTEGDNTLFKITQKGKLACQT